MNKVLVTLCSFMAILNCIQLIESVASNKTSNLSYSKGEKSGRQSQNKTPQPPISTTATPIPILRFENDNSEDGNYRFLYETANGINFKQQGQLLVNENSETTENEIETVVEGSYSYTLPDGTPFVVHYIADKNGYRASGDHIPTSPPIPKEILRSLERKQVDDAASTPNRAEEVLSEGNQTY